MCLLPYELGCLRMDIRYGLIQRQRQQHQGSLYSTTPNIFASFFMWTHSLTIDTLHNEEKKFTTKPRFTDYDPKKERSPISQASFTKSQRSQIDSVNHMPISWACHCGKEDIFYDRPGLGGCWGIFISRQMERRVFMP